MNTKRNNIVKVLRSFQFLLILLYPIAAHLSVFLRNPLIAIIILAVLMLSYISINTLKEHPLITGLVVLIMLILVVFSISQKSLALLYIPPIVISAMMLWAFSSTLLPGREPLVASFARILYDQTSDEVKKYTRRVTVVWSWFFIGMLVEIVCLSLFSTPKTWSLFCNILNYGFIAGLFVLEYLYRCYRFKIPGMLKMTLKALPKMNLRQLSANNIEQTQHALFNHPNLDDVFAFCDGKSVTCRDFLADVNCLLNYLPEKSHLINLCENRYYFSVLLACALLRNQVLLLPNNMTDYVVAQLKQKFPESACWKDRDMPDFKRYRNEVNVPIKSIPKINANQLAVIVYTSGSTGEPSPWEKTWGDLVIHTHQMAKALGLSANEKIHVVATVAAQHMYGLEHSVMLPMQMGYVLDSNKTFFVEDIRQSLQNDCYQQVLFSTPVHLKLCVKSATNFPNLRLLVSATAPLANDLCAPLEKIFQTTLYEIYGCTEAGGVAVRRPAITQQWSLLNDYQLVIEGGVSYVVIHDAGRGISKKITLSDKIEKVNAEHFLLLGRLADNINVAGKRMNLSDLNIKLNSIPGVKDGVFYMFPEIENTSRLMAFVVAPDLTVEQICSTLRKMIDPVFLPRPMVKLEQLPRNAVGKISRASIEPLIHSANG